ncbi:outer membrane protein assembly factor BamA [Bryobacter aggregatus]|uniref:outer membrane protein assembly factor BamA n=1 Tax=Bryobacter aggregatus TaxID=360054 RepID=UPI001EE3A087|nr:outer membrane protein assembly factor BamA [Bryobacter aggregatus]
MMSYRRGSLGAPLLCLFVLSLAFPLDSVLAQQAGQQPPAPQPAKPKPANPFETVPNPTTQEPTAPAPKPVTPATPGKPQLETPAEPKPEAAPADAPSEDVIEAIEFRGSRRVPQDTLRALIITKKGDRYSEDALNRDFMALWNTARFDDIRLEREAGRTGWIIRFVVTERRVVRSIKYDGMKSITVSEILDRFKERKVGLQVEQQYDPNKVQRAANTLKEYLSERGRQFATVTPEIRQIPPSSLEVNFRVSEGPKVKVGLIDVHGNKAFNAAAVRRAMKNLRPIGIPYSILFEEIFPKTYDATKLEEDMSRVQSAYQDKGYFTARATAEDPVIKDYGGSGFRIPLFYPNKPGKRADLRVNIDEGPKYHLQKLNLVGVKFFRAPEEIFSRVLGMGEGDVFSTAKLRKGMEDMRKLYGQFGFLDFVPEPSFDPDPKTGKIELTLTVDEGKQFFVRRIDFAGNTTTRDKVIRREILLDEGDLFNSRLWEVSLLRLNQLGYFEVLKENEAANITRDTKNNTVDITLKVKERGKNSVQMSGGVSGIAGSFISFGYSTNNFLGLGETLSIETQLGDRIRSATFGFTEPYFMDKPIQVGATVFYQRFNYDQGREVSLFSGRDYSQYYNQLGRDNLLNYSSNGYGFTAYASTLLRRSFARVGITYSYSNSKYKPQTTAANTYFEAVNFQNLDGPNQLSGVRQSSIIPNYSYNTVDHPITPSRGKSIYISSTFAGSFMGGNVNMIEPQIDVKYFRAGLKKGHVIGMHGLGRFITGYGGKTAPPFNRFYMGGENDIRGFQIWQISPIAYIPTRATVPVYNEDGSPRIQRTIGENGQLVNSPVSQNIPVYQVIQPGGDTQGVGNFEYRIPIFGPVVLAAFADIGVNRISRSNGLNLNPRNIDVLNATFPQAGFDNKAVLIEATQKPRMSTGLELQIMMPVVNAPFRFYYAYNPLRIDEVIQPPIAADRSYFPNQTTFFEAVRATGGGAVRFQEQRKTFRFTISRTF